MASTPPGNPDSEEQRADRPDQPNAPNARGPSSSSSSSSSSSGARLPKSRPRYLLVALIAALVFGAGCWTEGCSRLAMYRGDRDHGANVNAQIHDEADRAQAETLYQQYLEAADASRGRGIPLGAATFILGAALLALASRGLTGKSNTRSALMQVTAAQAILVCATYFAMPAVRNAEADWEYQCMIFSQHDKVPADPVNVALLRAARVWVPPGWLVVRTLASALILLALSRPRARAFFEASSSTAATPSGS